MGVAQSQVHHAQIHILIHAHTHTRPHTYTPTHTPARTPTHTHTRPHTRPHTHPHTHPHTYTDEQPSHKDNDQLTRLADSGQLICDLRNLVASVADTVVQRQREIEQTELRMEEAHRRLLLIKVLACSVRGSTTVGLCFEAVVLRIRKLYCSVNIYNVKDRRPPPRNLILLCRTAAKAYILGRLGQSTSPLRVLYLFRFHYKNFFFFTFSKINFTIYILYYE